MSFRMSSWVNFAWKMLLCVLMTAVWIAVVKFSIMWCPCLVLLHLLTPSEITWFEIMIFRWLRFLPQEIQSRLNFVGESCIEITVYYHLYFGLYKSCTFFVKALSSVHPTPVFLFKWSFVLPRNIRWYTCKDHVDNVCSHIYFWLVVWIIMQWLEYGGKQWHLWLGFIK